MGAILPYRRLASNGSPGKPGRPVVDGGSENGEAVLDDVPVSLAVFLARKEEKHVLTVLVSPHCPLAAAATIRDRRHIARSAGDSYSNFCAH
jgi:hypothetical protein